MPEVNPFAKRRTTAKPYAVYVTHGKEFHVLQVRAGRWLVRPIHKAVAKQPKSRWVAPEDMRSYLLVEATAVWQQLYGIADRTTT